MHLEKLFGYISIKVVTEYTSYILYQLISVGSGVGLEYPSSVHVVLVCFVWATARQRVLWLFSSVQALINKRAVTPVGAHVYHIASLSVCCSLFG